jgi:ribosomal protein L34E
VDEARRRLGVLEKESISVRRVVRRGPGGRVSRAERKRTEGVEARARSNTVLIILGRC